MTTREKLGLKLKILAGLPPASPTDDQLREIVRQISKIIDRTPTDADWKAAAGAVVPQAGTYKYAGEDTSDLNALLALMRKQGETL